MDPRERLRLALRGAGCTRCGRPYGVQGIRVLAQREEIAFVQLVCSACQVQTLALVTGLPPWPDESEAEVSESQNGTLSDGDETPPAGEGDRLSAPESPAITAADVAEMRSFLATYEGDIDGLLGDERGRGLGGR